jgi:Domain of unknown function (DUF4331)
MSHHFDTPTAQEDPRINVCDYYLFQGSPGSTVMAMTVNPNAGVSAPDTFREEGLYAFRFDTNGDAREEITFKVQFGDPAHANGDEHTHVQQFKVRRATGAASRHGAEGEIIAEGQTGETANSGHGVRAFAGLVPELFAGDGAALIGFLKTFYAESRFDSALFLSHKNLFTNQNVTAIVLEVPNRMLGQGTVHSWATCSLHGHAPEMQVSRWGLPLITHVFLSDPSLPNLKEDYNRAQPADDLAKFGQHFGLVAEKLSRLAGSAPDPVSYGKQLTARLCPTTLPYEIGSPAAFDFAGINGRSLTDDVMDVILSLATNTALGDGVAPDKGRTQPGFPYFGTPYTKAEQADVRPSPRRPPKQ